MSIERRWATGTWGDAILVAGALLLAVAGEAIGRPPSRWDILIVAAAAVLGGFVASEWFGDAGTWGWELDGLFVRPALIGAVVLGGLAEVVTRIVTPYPQIPAAPQAPTSS